MAIHILSDDLAAKIAAGEVIERPSSAVKELVENALDAGGRDIRIEVRGGGQRLIRVADDGCGIPSAQVPLAFARHGTSKLATADDLFAIRTLGFRGEALPSIAAVARVTLITHAEDENAGTLYKLEGSTVLANQPQGAPHGTVITIQDLFTNVPARLKFLKAPGTEAAHIAELVTAYALAYPDVRFTLVNDGRLAFQSPGSGRLFDVMLKAFGVETAREMISVNYPVREARPDDSGDAPPDASEPDVVRVQGYTSPPSIHRGTRKLQYFFVNGRWVQDRSLAHAVVEAYHTLLMVGRFPLFALNVQLPPEAVDVNVHPNKSEVRFREPGVVFRAVQKAVRRALSDYIAVPSVSPSKFPLPQSPQPPPGLPPTPPDAGTLPLDLPPRVEPAAASSTPPVPDLVPRIAPPPLPSMPMLRVLGQIASTYIIAEGPDGLYLVDQHAAHERVLYDRWTETPPGGSALTQELLEPVPVELMPLQWACYQENQELFGHVGFHLEPFGGQTLLVRGVPGLVKGQDPRRLLLEILDEWVEGGQPLEQAAEARLVTSICKSAAVKGGQVLSLDEMRALVRDLERTRSPRTCPHGRPTMIQLNLGQLEREFGRRG